MSTRWIAATVALVAVAVTPALLTSPDATQAGWREELTISLPDTQSGAYGVTVTDTTYTVDHTQGAPADVANEPSMTIRNDATSISGWIDVISAVATIPSSNTTNTLLGDTRLSYDPTTTDCLSGPSGSTYWSVNGGNALTAGTEYSRNGSAVPGDDLAPGQTKTLCPLVSRTINDRSFLLAHGGRQLDIQTKVRQRTHAPATASSATATQNTRYQVKLPPATRPSSDNVVCARTTGGTRSVLGDTGRLYWAWPFAGDSTTTTTPAVDRFVLIRSTNGTTWAPFYQTDGQTVGPLYQTNGDARESPSISSRHLANGATTPVYLSVRAYLYPGTNAYVDADWMVQVSEGSLLLVPFFTCRTNGSATATSPGVNNSNSTPVGLG